jgi:glucose-1-phosphate thymidylyltransferase
MSDSTDLTGVILAAGKGTRMHPFSEHYPKPILPVAGKPLVAHQLGILAEQGVRDVIMVIGHLGHEVARALGDGSSYGVNITYVEQEQTLGIAHAVSCLERHVDRPFFLFLGDIFFETADLGTMLEKLDSDRGVEGVLAVKREEDPAAIRRNFIVMTDATGRVTRVIEKPRYPRSNLKGCGVYLFRQAFFDAVRRTPRTAMRDEYEITDSIQMYIDDGYRVEAAEVIRDDVNLSYPKDLLDLNLHHLDLSGQKNLLGDGVQIQPGALVEHSVLMDAAVVESGATLFDCLVFPGVRVPAGREWRQVVCTPENEIHCGREP